MRKTSTMNEMYLFFFVGAIAGLVAAFLGGMVFYRDRLKTHLMLKDRVEAERTALQEDISEIGQDELAETDAGKELILVNKVSIQQFGQARESLTASLKRHNYDLLKQIDEDKKRFAQSEERLKAMEALQQESAQAIENLRKENTELRLSNSLKNKAAPSTTNSVQLEQDLRTTLEEVAHLQNQLAEANMRTVELQADGITSFTQDLRQTLSATLEYVDLLLGESVGPLTAMQRNFVETIKASTARLSNVINDFIQIATLKAGLDQISREPIDLNLIIQDALDETKSEVRAKRLTLNVDLPENLGSIHADREALEQILSRLLSNAVAASSLQGTVRLQAETKWEEDKEYLSIQVSDTGGGIPVVDLPRVFVPLYRAEDMPAQGVGETGMGLFIVKTLTEAQNGRIWVDTDLGVGSTYNVLVPIDRDTPTNRRAEE